MATRNVQVQSGNRIVVELDGKPVGLIQSLRASEDYGLEPAYGIGDIDPVENVPTRASYTLSITAMVLILSNLRALGIATENGDGALTGRVYDIVFYSKDTLQILRKYMSCSWASGDISVDANRITMQQGQMRGLGVTGLGL